MSIHFQWDNCGEQKNFPYFIFTSLLVELGYFPEISVGFLIVGHTHCSIDQYFSCLRRRIKGANFIASPPALHHLFGIEIRPGENFRSSFRPPLLQIQLTHVRDYKKAFAPYFNNQIKNYNVPYQFRFFTVVGKCCCQYKQYSTSPTWFPVMPTDVVGLEDLAKAPIFEIHNEVRFYIILVLPR